MSAGPTVSRPLAFESLDWEFYHANGEWKSNVSSLFLCLCLMHGGLKELSFAGHVCAGHHSEIAIAPKCLKLASFDGMRQYCIALTPLSVPFQMIWHANMLNVFPVWEKCLIPYKHP